MPAGVLNSISQIVCDNDDPCDPLNGAQLFNFNDEHQFKITFAQVNVRVTFYLFCIARNLN